MRKRVTVVGAGVAGLTAAHELIERGFQVTVFERRNTLGGKARTIPIPREGAGKSLPGEHGFRFFPGFYRHLPHTMSRIPYGPSGQVVSDNLVGAELEYFASYTRNPLPLIPRRPANLEELRIDTTLLNGLAELGLTQDDMEFYFGKLFEFLTSCEQRRMEIYERQSWWKFLDADNRSEPFRKFLVIGMTRNLVACRAERANARTVASISLQLWFNLLRPDPSLDRVLNGSTEEVWFKPWRDYLESEGVKFEYGHNLSSVSLSNDEIECVTFEHGEERIDHRSDYYVFALPVEQIAPLLNDEFSRIDPMLSGIPQLVQHLDWMVGIQYLLPQSPDLPKGHVDYVDSEWALTSVCQEKFWPKDKVAEYENGRYRAILSVDIADWDRRGRRVAKAARHCTQEEIAREVWHQLKTALNRPGRPPTLPEDVPRYFIDEDVEEQQAQPAVRAFVARYGDEAGGHHLFVNAEPLFINVADSWRLRPEAGTAIRNMLLAGDYVRTHTNLASMEAANESARRAVNEILARSNSTRPRCDVWPLKEPFGALRWADGQLLRRKLSWGNIHGNVPVRLAAEIGKRVLGALSNANDKRRIRP